MSDEEFLKLLQNAGLENCPEEILDVIVSEDGLHIDFYCCYCKQIHKNYPINMTTQYLNGDIACWEAFEEKGVANEIYS